MMLKYYVTGLFLFCLIGTTSAQITISSNEWPSAFGTEWHYSVSEDTMGVGIPVNLGTTGGPQTWTFSQAMFPSGEAQTITLVDPTTTPYTSSFPTADHAWHTTGLFAGVTINTYSYGQLTSNEWLSLGYAGNYGGFSVLEDNIPDDVLLVFPATLGTSWTSNYTVTTTPFAGATEIDSTSRSSMVDAWGTVQLPTGSYNCLRVRNDEISYYDIYVGGFLVSSDVITSYSYTWITEQEGYLAEVISLEDEPNPNFTLAEEVTYRTTAPNGLNDIPSSVINEFDLYQNYPNPFNPETTIRYAIPVNDRVKISIYNILGEEIKTLVDQIQTPGTYSVVWDGTDDRNNNVSSGIYIYKFVAGNFQKSMKMIYTK